MIFIFALLYIHCSVKHHVWAHLCLTTKVMLPLFPPLPPPPPHTHSHHHQARNLIQQGKSRGQVTLVVATRGHVPSLSQGEWNGDKISGGGANDNKNKMKEIPDGVVLRKKKKSMCKLYV